MDDLTFRSLQLHVSWPIALLAVLYLSSIKSFHAFISAIPLLETTAIKKVFDQAIIFDSQKGN